MKNERGKMTERREAIDASSGKTGFLVRPLEIHDANAAANTRRASTQPKRTRKCSERALLAAVEYSSAYFLLEPTFLAECVAARMLPSRRATVRWCLGLCVVLLLDGFVFLPLLCFGIWQFPSILRRVFAPCSPHHTGPHS